MQFFLHLDTESKCAFTWGANPFLLDPSDSAIPQGVQFHAKFGKRVHVLGETRIDSQGNKSTCVMLSFPAHPTRRFTSGEDFGALSNLTELLHSLEEGDGREEEAIEGEYAPNIVDMDICLLARKRAMIAINTESAKRQHQADL
ncbi:hypothetical protein BASA81_005339 [Batrachochytrium salamandrivorans]|nr:hypothetical protein BASA81_005339 [Batrachochytrium salamandrivorans]